MHSNTFIEILTQKKELRNPYSELQSKGIQ